MEPSGNVKNLLTCWKMTQIYYLLFQQTNKLPQRSSALHQKELEVINQAIYQNIEGFLFLYVWPGQLLMGSKTGLLLSLPLHKLILGSKGRHKKWKLRFIPFDSKHIRTTYTLIKYFIFLKKPVGSSFIILSCMNLQIQRVACHYR